MNIFRQRASRPGPLWLLLSLLLGLIFGAARAPVYGHGDSHGMSLPVYAVQDYGYAPIAVPPPPVAAPLSPLQQHAPAVLAPGSLADYTLTLANYEAVTRTFRLSDTLPAGLAFVKADPPLTYDPAGRTLRWQGSLPPGHLATLIQPSDLPLPYIDLADFGAPNLCAEVLAQGGDCDDRQLTFNLGTNGYHYTLYGQSLSQISVAVDGLLLAEGATPAGVTAHNRWLPDTAPPGLLLAGLWQDLSLGRAGQPTGRWHAAILSGLLPGHDLFYAQWHNAAHAADPDLTVRLAIAVVLDGSGGRDGQAFYIYDNIADPARLVALGYTIGVEDRLGSRGMTYAYAPCCGDPQPPQGYPPPAGSVLQLRPILLGEDQAYQRTFHFRAQVTAAVPLTVANTVRAASSSPDPTLQQLWATHYLAVREQLWLPLLQQGGER